ncbi:ribonuclease R [Jannaschia aquimarina]|nr:ribonuclease R [Jannaschia aquimarina]
MTLPTKSQVLQWIADNPAKTSKRDIAKAFGIKGGERIDLKRLLREMEDEGHLSKRKKSFDDPNRLPPVSVLTVTGVDADGDLYLAPHDWRGDAPEPRVLYVPAERDPALAAGDRVLARLTEIGGEDHSHEGRLIRRLATGPKRLLGIYRSGGEGGRLIPVGKGDDREWRIPAGATGGARDGELVEAEQSGPKGRMGLPQAKVVTRLGDPGAARSVSLIAIHEHGLRDDFPDDVIEEAAAAEPVTELGMRTDLRDLPLITIDPSDARDHDDAVCALPDDDPKNAGGHVLWVAIADVAHYVRPGSALDREARERGNSTYFPDRVVPMLPDALSGDLCSLHEGVDRPCIAVRMQLAPDGEKIGHRFVRGLMRSPASLHYEEVQAAIYGEVSDRVAPHLDGLCVLWSAYGTLRQARARREPLDLDLPERRIVLDADGTVTSVAFKDRLDAHRLIEEAMILANVAAAETLEGGPLLFRVHEEPPEDKLDSLRETAEASGFKLGKGQVLRPAQLNRLLRDAADTELSELISMATLRSMQQAYYAPRNFGHFGLALRAYAHFTSPIRRYADLIVHRALIAKHGWGDDGLSAWDIEHLERTGEVISAAERRSMMAERDTNDRYLAAFLADKVGAEFQGRVTGVQGFGAFVQLAETGADGLIPVRSLGAEYFRYDRDEQTLTGSESGLVIGMGQPVTVRLAEVVPVTGGLTLELLSVDGAAVKRAKGGGRKPSRGRGKPKSRLRKVKRRR